MRWVLELEGRRVDVRAERLDANCVAVYHDDKEYRIDVSRTGLDALSCVDENRKNTLARVEATVRGDGSGQIWLRGRAALAKVFTLKAYALGLAQSRQQEDATSIAIVAPMGGRIVAITCVEGEDSRKNEGLLVIEAMKMENEVRAPASGTVTGLTVRVGDIVEAQSVLCTVTRAPRPKKD